MKGVEIREKSIRLVFTHEGELRRKTLMVGDKPMRPTPANRKYAERLVVEIRDRIAAGAFSMSDYFPVGGTVGRGGTVAQQLEAWLDLQAVASSTRASYESAIRFWKKNLGEQKTSVSLKHSDILKAIKDGGVSGKTTNNYVSVLRAAMDLAVLDDVLRANPVAKIKNAPHQKDPPDPFELGEADAIVSHMLATYPEPVGNMTEWRFFSGVRTSEMVGFRWSSIDWNRAQMEIREAVVRGERKTTKTNRVRQVDMNVRSTEALKRQKAHTLLAGGSVWLDPRYGTPWVDERAFRRSYWTPTLKKLGIRYRPPNNCRHTFATMLLMSDVKLAYAAAQMGHSVEMFCNVYSKWINGMRNDLERGKLDQFINAPVVQKVGDRE